MSGFERAVNTLLLLAAWWFLLSRVWAFGKTDIVSPLQSLKGSLLRLKQAALDWCSRADSWQGFTLLVLALAQAVGVAGRTKYRVMRPRDATPEARFSVTNGASLQ